MKNRNKIATLLLTISLVVACSDDNLSNDENLEQQINYQELALGIDRRIESFSPYFKNAESINASLIPAKDNNLINKEGDEQTVVLINLQSNVQQIEYSESDLPDIFTNAQKGFLLPYFNEIGNVEGKELLRVISKYKNNLDIDFFSNEEYEQILVILNTQENVVTLIEESLSTSPASKTDGGISSRSCFWDCMADQGRNIGRGLAGGAIAGAATGAFAGAVGGTVVFPILGTATGAVAGAVFGAAEGAIYGASTAALFGAADCLTQCGGSGSGGGGSIGLASAGGCTRVSEPIGATGNSMIFQVCQ